MTQADSTLLLNRYTRMGDLTENVRRMTRRSLPAFAAILGLAVAYLFYTANPGAMAFALMSAGAVISLVVWGSCADGVPLLPMLVLQHLAIFGLPILSGHEVLFNYPTDFITRAGMEVLVFLCSIAIAWRIAMEVLRPAPATAYVLVGVDREGVHGLARVGFILAGAATGFLLLESLNLTAFMFSVLPGGAYPIVFAAVSAASACGFFLLSMLLGSHQMDLMPRLAFWSLLISNCLISASSLLLSSAALVLAAVVIGLFWGTGRLPWRFLLITAVVVSFFNTGKYAMRARYWHGDEDEPPPASGLLALPSLYAEWSRAGFASLVGPGSGSNPYSTFSATGRRAPNRHSEQSLLERLNDLQNVLFVMDAIENDHIPPLEGKSYAIIPPLLVPRILWPEKPRTHEGQVMLNVHFGRQDVESTFQTYVAWGLLAEAYGNFGAIKGAIILGVVIGTFFAWMEKLTSRKPLLSTEGLVAFAIFLGLANSYEAVASVMVTAIFQSIIPVVVASAPFVRRLTLPETSAT